MRFADASFAASIMISSSIRCWSTGGELVCTMKRSAPRIDSSYRQYVSPLANVRSDTSPTWMPSFSAILCASSGCERPAKSISRFDGPLSIQCSGLTSGFDSATSSPGRRVSSVVALSTEIALFRDLLRREPSERFGRDIFCYVCPARNPCVVPDLDRGFEAIVNAGPDVASDLRPALRATALMGKVRGDVAGGDVRVLADLGIADVGEVWDLRPRSDARGLDLDEGADLGALTDDAVGLDRDVGLDLHLRLDPGRSRIDDRDACEHVRLVDPVAELRRDERQL